jgi:hypothetical protein
VTFVAEEAEEEAKEEAKEEKEEEGEGATTTLRGASQPTRWHPSTWRGPSSASRAA